MTQENETPIAHLHFLVVDDHDFQRRALARILGSLGAKYIYEAADGRSALAIMRNPDRPIDIVISDLDMPEMDGLELLRHLGESGAPVSFIVTSALNRDVVASVETMSEAYGIKLLGVVEKPLSPGKLQPLLRLPRPARALPEASEACSAFTAQEITVGLRNGEFVPFFQPKVDMESSRIVGAEALARWRHPRAGIVLPHSFVDRLEDSGLIDELTWAMIEQVLATYNSWRSIGLEPATVSVNISLKSLSDVQFADRVTECLRQHNVDPRNVILELTESTATTNVGRALENLARLRMKGFGLSIDDYGTGYSSMQQLTRIAFTELKIDRFFVTNAGKQQSARVVLESSLEMARRLNLTVVAEGVETQAEWDLLRQLGCRLAQGYFIAKPMAAVAYLDWVRVWTGKS